MTFQCDCDASINCHYECFHMLKTFSVAVVVDGCDLNEREWNCVYVFCVMIRIALWPPCDWITTSQINKSKWKFIWNNKIQNYIYCVELNFVMFAFCFCMWVSVSLLVLLKIYLPWMWVSFSRALDFLCNVALQTIYAVVVYTSTVFFCVSSCLYLNFWICYGLYSLFFALLFFSS